MPDYFNNILVVTKDELIPTFFNNENHLAVTIQRFKNKEYGIKRVMLGGNGRQMLISYDSLPNEIKNALPDPRKCKHILERYYKIDAEAVRFYNDFEFEDGTDLEIEHQEKYIINASMIKALFTLRTDRINERIQKNKPAPQIGVWATLVGDATSFNETLWAKHKVKHTLPAGEKQFKTVLKAFETTGFKSLISRKHKNDNSRKVTDNTLELLRNMFANKRSKPTATEIYRQYDSFIDGYTEVINNATGEVYHPSEFKKLSKGTVKKYLATWTSQLGTHQKRSDNRQLNMGKFKPFYSFDMPKFAGSILSIDDRQPPFKTIDGKRVWFYLGVDIASRAITCFVYGDSKEGIITEFYRQMVRNYAAWGFNLPAELECEMSLNSSFTGTFLKPGIMFDHIKMEANNARGKYIERVNEELRYRKEKGKEGWLARPKALSEANQPGADIEKVPRLPYERIINECLQDIEDWNNEPHPTADGVSRWAYFTANQHPNLQATNYKAFIKHIGRRTPSSCHVGNIRFNNDWFLIADAGKVAKGDKLIQYMAAIEGKDIEVYWLDDDNGQILKAMAYVNGNYACEIVRKPRPNRAKIERGDADQLAEAQLAAYTNTVEHFARQQMASLETVTIIDNRPKPERVFKIAKLNPYHISERPVEVLPDADEENPNTPPIYTQKTHFDRF